MHRVICFLSAALAGAHPFGLSSPWEQAASELLAAPGTWPQPQPGQVQVVTATRSWAGTWPPLYMGQMETPDPLTGSRDPRGKSQSGCLHWLHPRSILSRRVLRVGIAARPESKC